MPKRAPAPPPADGPREGVAGEDYDGPIGDGPQGPSPDDEGMGATDSEPQGPNPGTHAEPLSPQAQGIVDRGRAIQETSPVKPKRAPRRKPATAKAPPGNGTIGNLVPQGDDPSADAGATNAPHVPPDDPEYRAHRMGLAVDAQAVVSEVQREFPPDDAGDLEFHSLDDLTEWLKVMYWGQEGSRKTTNALQVTKLGTGKVVLVNAEGGAKKTPLRKHGVDTSRVMVWPPEGQRVTFAGLERLFYRIAADLMNDPGSWLATVWDSATDIHQALLDQVVEADIAQQEAIIAKNKGRRPGNVVVRDRFDTDRDDYKRMSNQFRLLLRKFRDLPCHFVVTALLRTDEVARKPMRGPAVTPAIGTDLMGYMDIVLFTQVARFGEAHVGFAQTVPDEHTRAKDRFDVLPAELPNPSMDRLYAYVNGELTADNDEDLSLMSAGSPAVKAAAAGKKAVESGKTDAQVGAAVKAEIAQQEAPNRTTRATAVRRTSGKKRPATAEPAPTGGPDDQPPF